MASSLRPTLTLCAVHTVGLEEAGQASYVAINGNSLSPAIRTEQTDAGLRWKPGSTLTVPGGLLLDVSIKGAAHTRNGTDIDVSDILGIQTSDSAGDPACPFEAGWGPHGAVCVARTRWPDLLDLAALIRNAPTLGGRCDPRVARRRGAPILTRVMIR